MPNINVLTGTENPNKYINTRIPNLVFWCDYVGLGPSDNRTSVGGGYCLRRTTYDVLNNQQLDKLGLSIRKGARYNKSKCRSGITPYDNGYLNDGGTYSTSAEAPSRFATASIPGGYYPPPKAWWNDIVIYCYDLGNTDPTSGYDNVEIFIIPSSGNFSNPIDLPYLNFITKRLVGIQSYIMQNSLSQNNNYSGLFQPLSVTIINGFYYPSNYYLTTPSVSAFDFVDSKEYIFNIQFRAPNFNNPMTLISRSGPSNDVLVNFELTILDADTISITINDGTIVFSRPTQPNWIVSLPTNTWINITVTFTSAQNSGLTINLVQVQLKIIFGFNIYLLTTVTQNTNLTSSNGFVIGCQPYGGLNATATNFFNGYIDWVYFSNNTTGTSIFSLEFENFASDYKSFTDNTGKVFTINPDPTFPLTQYDCLNILSRPEFLCVNTHYPDISSVGNFYELQLLTDFGFIPSYPRGGGKAFDLSGNSEGNLMTLSGSFSYIHQLSSGNFGGGHVILHPTDPNGSYFSVPYNSKFNDLKNLINIWVMLKVTGEDQIIYSFVDLPNYSGYFLHLNNDQLVFTYGNGTQFIDVVIPIQFYNHAVATPYDTSKLVAGYTVSGTTIPGWWYNIICQFNTTGNDFRIYISDAQPDTGITTGFCNPGTSFGNDFLGTASVTHFPASSMIANTIADFKIGCDDAMASIFSGYYGNVTSFDGAISLISIWNNNYSDGECQKLYNAYTNLDKPYLGEMGIVNRYLAV